MTAPKFFICKKCGNIVGMVYDSKQPLSCCGEAMQELVPNTVDAAKEKHVPAICIDGNQVHVHIGSTEHPMAPEHYIEWVYLQTNQGGQRKLLHPGAKPQVVFSLTQDDFPIAAYAYCNLHGLWMTKF